MLTNDGGRATNFPIYGSNSEAALRLPVTSLLSTPIFDFCAIIFLPALKICFDIRSTGRFHDFTFWTLASAFSIVLIYTQGGYYAPLKKKYLKSAGLAVAVFLATCLGMLAASHLSIDDRVTLSSWTFGELSIVPTLLLCIRYLLSINALQVRPLAPGAGPVIICRGTCPSDLKDFLVEEAAFPSVSNTFTLGMVEKESDLYTDPTISSGRTVLDQIIPQDIADVIFVDHSGLKNIDGLIPQVYLQTLLIRPIRIWLAVDTSLEFNRAFIARPNRYRLIPLSPKNLVSSTTLSKRIFDIIITSILLICSIPVLLTLAVLVRASGPGPIIFRQKRIGAQGRYFNVLKFRTMKNAPESPFFQACLNDERVTKIGRFLRRSSLDELLQMVNVLRGEMSLVGPRPHAPETHVDGVFFDAALDSYPLRYRVKPGITGLAQIRGLRGATNNLETLRLRTESDLEYIRTWSLWLDIKILLKSVHVVIKYDAY